MVKYTLNIVKIRLDGFQTLKKLNILVRDNIRMFRK